MFFDGDVLKVFPGRYTIPGSYVITITGTYGGLVKSAQVSLKVHPPEPAVFP
jgi:hypothetical protein